MSDVEESHKQLPDPNRLHNIARLSAGIQGMEMGFNFYHAFILFNFNLFAASGIALFVTHVAFDIWLGYEGIRLERSRLKITK